jgi:hypothetical protein
MALIRPGIQAAHGTSTAAVIGRLRAGVGPAAEAQGASVVAYVPQRL